MLEGKVVHAMILSSMSLKYSTDKPLYLPIQTHFSHELRMDATYGGNDGVFPFPLNLVFSSPGSVSRALGCHTIILGALLSYHDEGTLCFALVPLEIGVCCGGVLRGGGRE